MLRHASSRITSDDYQQWHRIYDLSSSTAPDAHRAILEALESGNRKEAQAAMKNLIVFVRKSLIDYMKDAK